MKFFSLLFIQLIFITTIFANLEKRGFRLKLLESVISDIRISSVVGDYESTENSPKMTFLAGDQLNIKWKWTKSTGDSFRVILMRKMGFFMTAHIQTSPYFVQQLGETEAELTITLPRYYVGGQYFIRFQQFHGWENTFNPLYGRKDSHVFKIENPMLANLRHEAKDKYQKAVAQVQNKIQKYQNELADLIDGMNSKFKFGVRKLKSTAQAVKQKVISVTNDVISKVDDGVKKVGNMFYDAGEYAVRKVNHGYEICQSFGNKVIEAIPTLGDVYEFISNTKGVKMLARCYQVSKEAGEKYMNAAKGAVQKAKETGDRKVQEAKDLYNNRKQKFNEAWNDQFEQAMNRHKNNENDN